MSLKSGGLYKNVKMSLNTANILVAVGIVVLVAVFIFVINNNGFTVEFDTQGGTEVESMRAMHGDMLLFVETPEKQGYTFTGWYRDKACTDKWRAEADTVTGSMTLYAGWQAED